MCTIAIMGNGPIDHVPDLKPYEEHVDIWIGADRGALILIENEITPNYAIGDFDSIQTEQRELIMDKAIHFEAYPAEKNETDLELAIQKARNMNPEKIYFFGVTGGRLDHALINMQLLYNVVDRNIRGIIIDRWNQLELTKPGKHTVRKSVRYPYISFVPFSKHVKNLSLTGFYYPLTNYDISWGSTRCISNELMSQEGTFSFETGLLFIIKSCDNDSDHMHV